MSPAWSKDPRRPTWCVRISGSGRWWVTAASEGLAISLARSHATYGCESMIGRGYLKTHGQLVVTMMGYVAPDGSIRNWRGTETMR